MSKRLLGESGFLFFSRKNFAPQEKLIACNSERNSDKSYSIYANSKALAEYTVKLNFRTIGSGRTLVTKLIPANGNSGSNSFNYTFNYYPGRCLNRMPDTGLVYLLPASSGSTLRTAWIVLAARCYRGLYFASSKIFRTGTRMSCSGVMPPWSSAYFFTICQPTHTPIFPGETSGIPRVLGASPI